MIVLLFVYDLIRFICTKNSKESPNALLNPKFQIVKFRETIGSFDDCPNHPSTHKSGPPLTFQLLISYLS